MTDSFVPFTVTKDAFLDGKLEILQPEKGQRAGIDAVLLAASIPAVPKQSLLEAGIGAGVVSLCAAFRIGGVSITGVEVQNEMAELARCNAAHNNLLDSVKIITGDVTSSGNGWRAMGLEQDSFDHAFANPPFYDSVKSRKPESECKATAHMIETGALERWVKFLVAHTKPKGTVTIIHVPDVLNTVLQYFDKPVGEIRVFPIFSKKEGPATRLIIQGIKSSKAPLRLETGLVMHGPDGRFSEQANRILREGASLWEV